MSTKTLLKGLCIYYKTYDDLRHYYFERWCAKYAHEFDISKRLLVKNDVLYNWYLHEWNQNVEQRFLIENNTYLQLDLQIDDHEHLQELFYLYPEYITSHYPDSILKKIRVESKFLSSMESRTKE